MTFDPARPRYTLPFGKDYDLIGTFEMIEAIEWAMKKPVGETLLAVVNGMETFNLAKLIAAMLTANKHEMTAKQAADVIWNEIGITGEDNDKLRLHLYSFLSICLAPPKERESKAKEVGELMGSLNAETASRGENTKKSA